MFLKVIFFVLIGCSAIVYGDEAEIKKNRFVGGRETVPGEFPSVVSIQTPVTAHSHCNGVIVNANHVITSCRCVYNTTNHLLNPFWLRIIAGDLNIVVPSYRRFTTEVIRIYPHPLFNPETNANDIAVLRVRNAFPLPHNTIDISVRNQRVLPNGAACRAAGWGSLTNFGNNNVLTATQRAIPLPILDRTICNAGNVHSGRVQESMICAGGVQANSPSLCQGSLGAGLFCADQLTGILSFGLGCGLVNQPPVFTQVRFFNNWIEQQFRRNDVIRPGTPVGQQSNRTN